MNGILLGVIAGILAIAVMLAVKRGKSSQQASNSTLASNATPATPAPTVKKKKWMWLWLLVPVAVGMLFFSVLYKDERGGRRRVVVSSQYTPDQPWKVFATLPAGTYRFGADGEYGLYVVMGGVVTHQRVRANGDALWNNGKWRKIATPSFPPLPVQGAPLGSLIYRVEGWLPRSYTQILVLDKPSRVDISINLWENYSNTEGDDPAENFTKNLGGLLVWIEEGVTS